MAAKEAISVKEQAEPNSSETALTCTTSPLDTPHSGSPSPSTNKSLGQQRFSIIDLCLGSILWLPRQSYVSEPIYCAANFYCSEEIMESGAYNHAMVVLALDLRWDFQEQELLSDKDMICTVALITTFGDESLPSYLRNASRGTKRKYALSLPITDEDSYAEYFENPGYGNHNRKPLCLVAGEMRKQSYVRLDQVWDIPASELRLFNPSHTLPCQMRLSKESYNTLMYELRIVAESTNYRDCEASESQVGENQVLSASTAEIGTENGTQFERGVEEARVESKLGKFIADMNVY